VIIEIFGIERSKCKVMMEHSREALDTLDLDGQLKYISEPIEIHNRGVFLTPALAVNGHIKLSGKVPSKDEIIELIQME
jgi:small redox-active disulfide protein 2